MGTVQKIPLDFTVSAHEYIARQLGASTCKNWYGDIDEKGNFKLPYFPFPGSELFSDDGKSMPVRYMYSLNGNLHAVVGNEFRIYNDQGGYKTIGNLNTAIDFARMIANDNQILITDQANGYVYQVVGTTSRNANSFFRLENASSLISTPEFYGTGALNDLIAIGSYTGGVSKIYKIQIDSASAPADTFRWSDTGGTTWNASSVTITGGSQTLNNGIQISFTHTTGHTKDDFWTFNTTTDNAFYPPLIPGYLDTYGVYPKQNSKRFYLTNLNDFSQIYALTFAQANAFPDNLVAAISVNQEMIMFCETTIEFWYDVGGTGFPFQRRPNILINYGCAAPYTLAVASNNILIWVGQNSNGGKQVLLMSGYQVKTISDKPLNEKLREYTDIKDAFAFVIEWEGHIFYFLTIPSADVTWVYDLKTERWYQRTTRRAVSPEIKSQDYVEGRYLASCHCYHNGMHLIGDYRSGKIYKLSQNYYKDGDEVIICEATSIPFHDNLNRVSIFSLQLVFQAATANITGTGYDPLIMLQSSKSGTYGWQKELRRTMGQVGEHQTRIKWNRLGTGRNWVFRIRNSDPVYRVLMGAIAEIEDTGQ